jgi:hypothetical protein
MNTSAYRHVVHFQFKEGVSRDRVLAIASAFRSLCTELPFVQAFEWGENSSVENINHGFTHCFIVTFADSAGRDAYLPHPAHQAFCRDHLDPWLSRVCVLDYEVNR